MVSTAPAPPSRSLEVTLDRPFFYYIADKNNVPVFAGIIGDPTAAND
jgi:serine protease inhibitor